MKNKHKIYLDNIELIKSKMEDLGYIIDFKKEPNIYLKDVEVIDVYTGPLIPEGKKSMTFRFSFGARYQTLTKAEIDDYTEKIIKAIEDNCGAKRR